MKSEKGVTLMALGIYVIVFIIISGLMVTITNGIMSNISELEEPVEAVVEFNKFSMLFISDVKQNETYTIISQNELQFEDETTYTYKENEKAIYRKVKDEEEVRIARYINEISFVEVEDTEVEGKEIIGVNMTIGEDENKTIERNIEFVLKYW